MTNGEKLKDLFNTYFPGVVLDEELLSESCDIFACPVDSMTVEELNSLAEKVSKEDYSPCKGCSYDNWWNKEYTKEVVEFNVNVDIFDLLEGVNDIAELKRINQKTKEMINAAYGNKGVGRAEGSDQFITKENEGGF